MRSLTLAVTAAPGGAPAAGSAIRRKCRLIQALTQPYYTMIFHCITKLCVTQRTSSFNRRAVLQVTLGFEKGLHHLTQSLRVRAHVLPLSERLHTLYMLLWKHVCATANSAASAAANVLYNPAKGWPIARCARMQHHAASSFMNAGSKTHVPWLPRLLLPTPAAPQEVWSACRREQPQQ